MESNDFRHLCENLCSEVSLLCFLKIIAPLKPIHRLVFKDFFRGILIARFGRETLFCVILILRLI